MAKNKALTGSAVKALMWHTHCTLSSSYNSHTFSDHSARSGFRLVDRCRCWRTTTGLLSYAHNRIVHLTAKKLCTDLPRYPRSMRYSKHTRN